MNILVAKASETQCQSGDEKLHQWLVGGVLRQWDTEIGAPSTKMRNKNDDDVEN